MTTTLPPLRLYLWLLMLGITALVTGCWEKQDHDLLLPEKPHYRLTGSVVDEVTQVPLSHIRVEVQVVTSIYDVPWETQTLYTDSAGFFSIDTIYPGSHVATIYRNDYQILERNFFLAHENLDMMLSVPEPMVATGRINLGQYNPGSFNPKFTWQGSILWIMGVHKGYIQHQNYEAGVAALIPARISGGIIFYDQAFLNPSPNAIGIIYAYSKLYAFYRDHAELILPNNGVITSTVFWDGLISGMTVKDGQFYTSWSNKIEARGTDITSVNSVLETTAENLALLTHDGNRFWALDQNHDRVVEFDSLGTVCAAYRMFDDGIPAPIDIRYMDFDTIGQLWISANQSPYLYWFE